MTDHIAIASNAAEAAAIQTIEQHHAGLVGGLSQRVQALMGLVAVRDEQSAEVARRGLATWCAAEIVPHAKAEEESMYPAAQATVEGRLLVAAMVQEHRDLMDLVERLSRGTVLEAAATATALQTLFTGHARKENELLLPLLAGRPEVSLAGLLHTMHDRLGDSAAPCVAGHTCGCHEDSEEVPELDARAIPHGIRHATIFGALDAVAEGRSLVLVAPHDPVPLLAQVEQRQPGAFTVEYLERGPEAWRLQFARSV